MGGHYMPPPPPDGVILRPPSSARVNIPLKLLEYLQSTRKVCTMPPLTYNGEVKQLTIPQVTNIKTIGVSRIWPR